MKTDLSLVTALTWIVGSMLIIPGGVYKSYHLLNQASFFIEHPICRIIQTTSQQERLSTSYLAYLMNISADKPAKAKYFDTRLAKKQLLTSPLIKEAYVQLIKPDTLYIDYAVRHPVAWIEDYENMAVDEERTLFPITPFFSPKKLPRMLLDLNLCEAKWGARITSYRLELALQCLKTLESLSVNVHKIDVSKAEYASLGQREIIVTLEEEKRERILRLTPKDFAKEIGNYLELRPNLTLTDHVIDLRIPKLAFIDSLEPS
ncbi:MAG: hypothetical protein QRY71_04200 [Candidatus Rhabdochlamydia sp.]